MRRSLVSLVLVLALWPVAAAAQTPAGDGSGRDEQVVLSGDVVVPQGVVSGEIVVFHGSAVVHGVAAGDVVVFDGPIVIGGQVRGSVVALDGDVRLLDTAQVAGDVLVGGTLRRAEGASVQGQVRTGFRVTLSGPITALGALLISAALAVSILVAGLLLLLVAPRGAERVAQAARSAPLASAGWGLALAVLLPVGGTVAAATIVALPLGLSVLLGLALCWFVGLAWTSWIVGRLLVREPGSRIGAMFAGWAITSAVGLVPGLNAVWWSLGGIFGFGAMTVAAWRARGTSKHRVGAAPPPPPPVPAEA